MYKGVFVCVVLHISLYLTGTGRILSQRRESTEDDARGETELSVNSRTRPLSFSSRLPGGSVPSVTNTPKVTLCLLRMKLECLFSPSASHTDTASFPSPADQTFLKLPCACAFPFTFERTSGEKSWASDMYAVPLCACISPSASNFSQSTSVVTRRLSPGCLPSASFCCLLAALWKKVSKSSAPSRSPSDSESSLSPSPPLSAARAVSPTVASSTKGSASAVTKSLSVMIPLPSTSKSATSSCRYSLFNGTRSQQRPAQSSPEESILSRFRSNFRNRSERDILRLSQFARTRADRALK
mmetsp:Transcript_43945/g.86740  ORF Transcript_43945/g.86740 Transcript_43945/m.86740 type:complete len:298 (-) Transcript_43945:578-1471(-)